MNPRALEIFSTRTNAGVDPTLHVWGWEIPVYLFFGGLVAGVMILLSALELRGHLNPKLKDEGRLRFMPWAAVALLSLGMLSLFIDLSNRLNVFRFYTALRLTSPMSWGSWLLLLVYPALIGLGLGTLEHAERRKLNRLARHAGLRGFLIELSRWTRAHRPLILRANLVVGIGLGVYTGVLLGTLVARPLWNSALLGPLFLVSGLSTGAALLMLVRPSRKASAHLLARLDLLAIAAELVLLALYLIGGSMSLAATESATALFLGGEWTPWFWSLVVVGGLIIPAMLELTELRYGLSTTSWSPVLILIGGLALRAILVAAGQDATIHLEHSLALLAP
ncbi:MAG: polysulfide reductase NrfD [Deltaproteobacteria bacterium]|nr:polysulfide reductase NrfD [Deltaproteobacteria bacterium]